MLDFYSIYEQSEELAVLAGLALKEVLLFLSDILKSISNFNEGFEFNLFLENALTFSVASL